MSAEEAVLQKVEAKVLYAVASLDLSNALNYKSTGIAKLAKAYIDLDDSFQAETARLGEAVKRASALEGQVWALTARLQAVSELLSRWEIEAQEADGWTAEETERRLTDLDELNAVMVRSIIPEEKDES